MYRKVGMMIIGCFFVLACAPWAALAEEEPGKDSAIIGRIPGYVMNEFSSKHGVLRPYNAEREEGQPVEGMRTRIGYDETSGKTQSSLAIIRTYSRNIVKMGGVVLGENAEDGWGSWKLKKGDKEIYINVEVANDGQWYFLDILEKGDLELDLLAPVVSAAVVAHALEQEGKATLPILFDTGKATINPDSFGIIAEACTALRHKPALKVSIDGHTDNQGNAQQNKALSEQRAAAVQSALQLCGVAGERLSARGFGQDKPIGDNGTEEGRSKNRRVELVRVK